MMGSMHLRAWACVRVWRKCGRQTVKYPKGFVNFIGTCDGLCMVTLDLDPSRKAERYNSPGAAHPIRM